MKNGFDGSQLFCSPDDVMLELCTVVKHTRQMQPATDSGGQDRSGWGWGRPA